MEKHIRIVKKGEDNSNLLYWLSQTPQQRMVELENIRQLINFKQYGIRQGFQRVYTVTKRV
jgi:hypothetical protein